MIAQAQSGTGKTATFAIAILEQIDISKLNCQALVLAPTRELAQQIQKVLELTLSSSLPPFLAPLFLPPSSFLPPFFPPLCVKTSLMSNALITPPLPPSTSLLSPLQVVIALGDYLDAQCHACIGGTSVRTDMTKLEMGQHVVVGTPGRVHDMIQRKALGTLPGPVLWHKGGREFRMLLLVSFPNWSL